MLEYAVAKCPRIVPKRIQAYPVTTVLVTYFSRITLATLSISLEFLLMGPRFMYTFMYMFMYMKRTMPGGST